MVMKFTGKLFILGGSLFILWLGVWYFWTYIFLPWEEETWIYQEREVSNYQFINPLLECEVKTLGSQQKYIPFEEEVRENIKTHIIDNNPDIEIAYYFRNLRNGPWFGYNEETIFAPASLMKLPVTMAYMKWAEEDSTVFGKIFSGIVETNSIQNIIPWQSIRAGGTYSLDELFKYSLIYSDNNANSTLLANIPQDLLFRVFRDLNIPIIDNLEQWEDEYITVKEYASFFRILFNSSYLSRTSSEYLLKIMSLAENVRGIKQKLPKDIVVTHKFWERWGVSKVTGTVTQQFHDCGIVYYDKYPYLLCVMTRWSKDFDKLESIIEDISYEVYSAISKRYQ